jgi:Family of unknown function (DUF6459)
MSVASDELAPLRLLPAPAAEPEFLDDARRLRLIGDAGADQETLPLEWPLPSGLGAVPRAGGLVLIRGARGELDDFGPVATPRDALPEPAPWAARLVQGIAEVLALDRPAAQLARWVCPEVFDEVRRRVDARRQANRSTTGPRRPTLRSLHVTEPADGVAEVCALVDDGRRARAYALRLEGSDGRWRATALDLV